MQERERRRRERLHVPIIKNLIKMQDGVADVVFLPRTSSTANESTGYNESTNGARDTMA